MTSFDEQMQLLTTTDKELFKKICRRLLKHTFIVKSKNDDQKKDYLFVIRANNELVLSQYLQFIGYDIIVDREWGVVRLVNSEISSESNKLYINRARLNKVQSITLCCLWTAFSERIYSESNDQYATILYSDFLNELEKYGAKDKIKKSELETALISLAFYNLIDFKKNVLDDDSVIILYPSLQFALDMNSFSTLVKATNERMKASTKFVDTEIPEEEEYEDGTNDYEL